MAQGSPLAGQFTIRGYFFSGPGPGPLDPFRVQLVFKGLKFGYNKASVKSTAFQNCTGKKNHTLSLANKTKPKPN